MYSREHIEKDSVKLIEYLKKQNDWIGISIKDMAEFLGKSKGYAQGMIQSLIKYPIKGLVIKKDNVNEPYMFRYIKDERIIKIKEGIDNYKATIQTQQEEIEAYKEIVEAKDNIIKHYELIVDSLNAKLYNNSVKTEKELLLLHDEIKDIIETYLKQKNWNLKDQDKTAFKSNVLNKISSTTEKILKTKE